MASDYQKRRGINMKNIYFAIVFLISCLPVVAQADGLYLGFGGGYVWDIPAKSEVSIEYEGQLVYHQTVRHEVALDSPFLLGSAGVEYNNWHLEFEIMGLGADANSTIRTVRIYKRWYIFNFKK